MPPLSPPNPVANRRRELLERLRKRPQGWRCADLAHELGVGTPTVKRDLQALAKDPTYDVAFDRRTQTWRASDASTASSIDHPEVDDLNAVLLARTILGDLVDAELGQRLDRLAEQIDDRLPKDGDRDARVPVGAVTASLTLGTPIAPERLRLLLGALGRKVLRVVYRGTWEPGQQSATFEPWHLRIHDGAAYLRGFWREKLAPRTLRAAQLDEVEVLEGARPQQTRPPRHKLWGDGDPAYGIDHHHPGKAVIVVESGVARWIAPVVWHPDQRDRWLVPNERLERTVRYRSRREMARRLLSILDGLLSVEPPELHRELDALVHSYTRRGPSQPQPST